MKALMVVRPWREVEQLREHRRLSHPFYPLDVPSRCHVEPTKEEKEDAKENCGKDHPGTNRKYHRKYPADV